MHTSCKLYEVPRHQYGGQLEPTIQQINTSDQRSVTPTSFFVPHRVGINNNNNNNLINHVIV